MAFGVLLITLSGHTSAILSGYLFGSLSIVTKSDVMLAIIIMVVVVVTIFILKNVLSTINNDSEYATSLGINVEKFNILFSILTSLTVAISIRTTGVLLIGALMVLPIAISSLFSKSINQTIVISVCLSVVICVTSVIITYFVNVPASSLIVLILILAFIISSIIKKF